MAYFPNGSSGEILDEQCHDCPLGAGWHDPAQTELFENERELRPCPVAFVQLNYNYDQIRDRQCDRAAEIIDGENLPNAAAYLRSDQFRDALNRLVNDQGICQVREQLKQVRKDTD